MGAMERRLRKRAGVWCDGRVAVSGGDLDTGIEGAPAIAADARLDNISDLRATLRCRSEASDAEIISASYARWGQDCVDHLHGDFAFALWDKSRQLLFCARDRFGVKPLYFGYSATQFALASESRAIRALIDAGAPSPQRIADFLAALAPEEDATWFDAVRRLPAGHTLTLQAGAPRLRRYWSLQPGARPSDPVGAVREAFDNAVRKRMDATCGAFLSGGIDSSSIALTAAASSAAPVRSVSIVFNDPALRDERRFIDAALAHGRFEPTFLDASQIGPLDDFDTCFAEHDGPVLAPGLAVTRQLYKTLAAAGLVGVLDGHGGDEIVSHGFGRIKELALTRDWAAVWKNVAAEADLYGTSRLAMFSTYWTHLGPFRFLASRTQSAMARLQRQVLGNGATSPLWRQLLDPRFAAESGVEARWRAARTARNAYRTELEHHLRALSDPIRSYALESFDVVAGNVGVEPRYPFFDDDLAALCVSLAPEDKLDKGWSRLAFRRAMETTLPPSIQWRRDKFDFTQSFASTLFSRHKSLLEALFLQGSGGLNDILDMQALRALYHRIAARPLAARGDEVQALWRCAAVGLWMQHQRSETSKAFATNPVVHS
jgi:asparagine synthase (glutamine-hydrolysing)